MFTDIKPQNEYLSIISYVLNYTLSFTRNLIRFDYGGRGRREMLETSPQIGSLQHSSNAA